MLQLILIVVVLVEISLVPVPSHAAVGKKYNEYISESKTVKAVSFAGNGDKMEDQFATIENIQNHSTVLEPATSLYGVFDGHGGKYAAQFTAANLLEDLKSEIIEPTEEYANYGELLESVVKKFEIKLNAELKNVNDDSGTCATIAIIRGEYLYVANVGDSRAVIGTEGRGTITVTVDHKPNEPNEMKRVADEGGWIFENAIRNPEGRGLRVTRSLGEPELKSTITGLTASPDTSSTNLKNVNSKFIILASDGLWDKLSSEEAVKVINDYSTKKRFGAEKLVSKAQKKGAHDDITVMVIKTNFNNL